MKSERQTTAHGEIETRNPDDIQKSLHKVIDDSTIMHPGDIQAARKRALRIGERQIFEQVEGNIRAEVMAAYLEILKEKLPVPNNETGS